jgi:hypothetical protein
LAFARSCAAQFFELKEAWNVARHSILHGQDSFLPNQGQGMISSQ